MHAPAVHASLVVGSHATHIAPALPHVAGDGVMHVVPAQQPDVQLCAHVSHVVPTQVSPLGQSPVWLQPHVSFGRQIPMPAQFCCSPWVHCTQFEVVVSQTSGEAQSLSLAHEPQTVVTVLLVAVCVLLPTWKVLVAWFV